MAMHFVNWWAVMAGAISMFILGGLWYSPVLFGRVWMSENGFRDSDRPNLAKILGLSLVISLIMAANLAFFLADAKTTAAWGATAGLLAGLGWVALSVAMIALFERRSWRYILINGGYMTTAFVLMGLILGAWRI